MDRFWHAFIPLFVAFDGIGLLPLFWGLAQPLNVPQRRQAVTEAVVTALLVAIGFLTVSRFIFTLMDLRVADVMIAGGAILIVLCLRELLLPEKPAESQLASPGIVPLGVPLLTGPAVLTTLLVMRDQYGLPATLVSLAVNLVAVWVVLRMAEALMRRLGREGAVVVSKISSLVLTAFGVMLIRRGVSALLQGPAP